MIRFLFALTLGAAVAGCSAARNAAVNALGNALSEGGTVYTSDNDPELVREALPFGLKTYESLLEASPEHQGLLLASARGFAAYAFFLQQEADRLERTDLAAARERRARASLHFIRGRDYALRGLEIFHPDFTQGLYRARDATLASTEIDDIDFLYWAGAAWAGALTAARNDPELIADLPIAGALVGRVLELDDTYERGTAHEFFISYEGGRPGGDIEVAREHYRRAYELSGGQRASVHLALAEAVAVPQQNLSEFRSLLDAALAVDPEQAPEIRLLNTISRRRAQWLESIVPELFLDAE